MPTCNNCGHTTEQTGEFCIKCGGRFPEHQFPSASHSQPISDSHISQEKFHNFHICPVCSYENPLENNFCTSCGRPFRPENYLRQRNDKGNLTGEESVATNNINAVGNELQETILELRQINLALSFVEEPSDLTSREFCSKLELRRVILLDALKDAIYQEEPINDSLSLLYFFDQVQEIAKERGESSSKSSLYRIAASQGMDLTQLGFEVSIDHPSVKNINESRITVTEETRQDAPISGVLHIDSPPNNPIDRQAKTYFDWNGLWTTLYSENAMSSFLGFGILLITISSLVLLVNYWPNEDMRLVLMGLAFVQMAAFIGVGHLVKEQIGLYFSGLALITIGAVWSIFATGIITYLLFDPISPDPTIPGIGLEINLQPLAWLIVSAISAPIWGILAYRYRGYVLTHGFILLAGITIFLAIASLSKNWDLWAWAISPIPVYGLSLFYLRSLVDKTIKRSLRHPLVWSGFAIGIAPSMILGYSYIYNPDQTNFPLALTFVITAFTSLDAIRHTSIRWLEHLAAFLLPLAILLLINEIDSNAERYIPIVLVSISFIYVFAGSKLKFSAPTHTENKWPVLKPWYAVSIILMLSIPLLTSSPVWSRGISMLMVTFLTGILSQNWQKQPWPWIPLIPLTFLLSYSLDLIPIQVSDFSELFGVQTSCATVPVNTGWDCLSIPLRPSLISLFAITVLVCIWFSKGKSIYSYPVTVWAFAATLISIVWSLIYGSPGYTIPFVSTGVLAGLIFGIASLTMIMVLASTQWFQYIWEKAKVSIVDYLQSPLILDRNCSNCGQALSYQNASGQSAQFEGNCSNCGESSEEPKDIAPNEWVQNFSNILLSIGSLKTTSLFLILVLVPIWLIALLGYIGGLSQTLPAYATTIWWSSTALYAVALMRYKTPLFLYTGTVTIHLGLITLIKLPALNLDVNHIGLIISFSSILYLGLIATCYKFLAWTKYYSGKTKRYIFLPLLAVAGIDACVGLILSAWDDWANWEGLLVAIIYTIISIAATQVTKYRFLPYFTMGLTLVINIFIVGLIGGSWPARATGWAVQGLAFWWIARGLARLSIAQTKYDLNIWVGPLESSSTRTALFAGAFTLITLAARLLGLGTFDPDLIVPTSVIAILGLLYLGKAITENNPLAGYIAAGALLFSWYIQLIERDLSYIGIQFYTIPAGLYLFALAYFEKRRSAEDSRIALAANTLGVIVLSGSAFVQSIIATDGNELLFVLIGITGGVFLTIWGIFSKSKICFAGGILTFAINIFYQATSLLSGTDGAIIGIILGLFIIVLVIVLERAKSHLILRDQRFRDYIHSWDW
ncbi:zinc ribbon domain-containing protein [Chloroflexi bacterium]|nr:zinc ribbon domain-containing protein [Chloroflexota bacterium]